MVRGGWEAVSGIIWAGLGLSFGVFGCRFFFDKRYTHSPFCLDRSLQVYGCVCVICVSAGCGLGICEPRQRRGTGGVWLLGWLAVYIGQAGSKGGY